MKKLTWKPTGFTLMELMIAIVIIGILAAVAVPSYIQYSRRAYFGEVVGATAPYTVGVVECYHTTSNLADCDAGSNGVPAAIASEAGVGAVGSIAVANGVITVIPAVANGILATDTYILTPTATAGVITWAATGGGVTSGYAK